MRQILPTPIDAIDPRVAYDDMPRRGGRPWVRLTMVSSLDGATAVDGVSGALGGPADSALFLAIRSLADVILVAAGTMRAESYGPAPMPLALQQARLAAGLSPVPPIAVVTRSCDLDWSAPFFSEAVSRPIVVTAEDAPADRRDRAAEVADVIATGTGGVDLGEALGELGRRGLATVAAEGGPTLNGLLAAGDLIDELCLTVSPTLVGGDSARILTGAAVAPPSRMRLHSALQDGDLLFLRYRR